MSTAINETTGVFIDEEQKTQKTHNTFNFSVYHLTIH